VESFFEDHRENGRPTPGGLLHEDLGRHIFALGAYIGEVIRRYRGGYWTGDDDDPAAEVNVVLHLPSVVG
jgi:hypothetical protein